MKVGILLLTLAVSAFAAPRVSSAGDGIAAARDEAAVAAVAPENPPVDQGCSAFGIVSVPLSAKGWSLNCSGSDGNHWVHYNFKVPAGYFAFVKVYAENVEDDDTVDVADDRGVKISNNGSRTFSYEVAWPTDFSIDYITSLDSSATISINISVIQATPNQNIVKSYITFAGSGSSFLDTESWNEGESYQFTPKSSGNFIAVATSPSASDYEKHLWNNVFIYDASQLKGTLALLTQSGNVYTSTNPVILYMAKKVVAPGAAVITDISNVGNRKFAAQYIPQGLKSFSCNISSPGDLTLISSRFKSVNVTLTSVVKSTPNSYLDYMKGGPVNDISNSVEIKTLPLTFTNYVNTFYASAGTTLMKFAVEP